MAAANGNGSTISERTRFSWPILVAIVGIALAAAAFGYALQSGIAVHCANSDVHHTTAQLNDDYAQKAVVDQKFEEVLRRLDRIETKLDRLQ